MHSNTLKLIAAAALITSTSAAFAQIAPNGGPSTSQNPGSQVSGGAQGGLGAPPTGAIVGYPGSVGSIAPNGGPSASQKADSEYKGGAQGSAPTTVRP